MAFCKLLVVELAFLLLHTAIQRRSSRLAWVPSLPVAGPERLEWILIDGHGKILKLPGSVPLVMSNNMSLQITGVADVPAEFALYTLLLSLHLCGSLRDDAILWLLHRLAC